MNNYFGDLKTKLEDSATVVFKHNQYVEHVYNQTGQMMPRIDYNTIKKCIVNKHRKYYGMTSKYDSNGKLLGGAS